MSGRAQAFIEIDRDHSGVLSKDEFAVALRRGLGGPAGGGVSEAEIEASFAAIDQDGNGTIQYLEFLAATQQTMEQGVSEEELTAAFERVSE